MEDAHAEILQDIASDVENYIIFNSTTGRSNQREI
jgi:hypothetical protein